MTSHRQKSRPKLKKKEVVNPVLNLNPRNRPRWSRSLSAPRTRNMWPCDLPDSITISRILVLLDVPSILRLTCTSRAFRTVANVETVWRMLQNRDQRVLVSFVSFQPRISFLLDVQSVNACTELCDAASALERRHLKPLMEIMQKGIEGIPYLQLLTHLSGVRFSAHTDDAVDQFNWPPSFENELKLMQTVPRTASSVS